MTWLIGLFARWGVPQSLRRLLGHLTLGIAVLALLWALWAIFSAREKADDSHNQAIGAAAEHGKAADQTIHNAENANAAAENVRRNSDAARDECLQNARNPANC